MPLGGVIGIRDGVAEASGDGGVVLQGGFGCFGGEERGYGVVLWFGQTRSNKGWAGGLGILGLGWAYLVDWTS